jgi:hypothetical protein
MTTTSTHRVAAMRLRRKQEGLVRIELYVKPVLYAKVKAFVKQLEKTK